MADQPTAPRSSTALTPALAGPNSMSRLHTTVSGATAASQMDAPSRQQAATPGALLRSLKRCWRPAALLGIVLAAVAATATWSLRPNKFTAYSLLRIASEEVRVLGGDPSRNDSGSYTRTQIAMIRSRPVLRAALSQEQIRQLPLLMAQADPIEWLERELKVELIDGTEIVRVSLSGRVRSGDLAPIINAVIEAYMASVVKTERSNQQGSLEELKKVYNDAEERVRRGQQSIQELARQHNSGDSQVLSVKQRTMLDEYASFKRELGSTAARKRALEVQMTVFKTRIAGFDKVNESAEVSNPVVEHDLDMDPIVRERAAEVLKAKEKLVEFDARAPAAVGGVVDPARTAFQSRVEKAEAALAQARKAGRIAVTARYQSMQRSAAEAQLRDAEIEMTILDRQLATLQQEVDTLRKEVDRLGINSVELELRRADHEMNKTFMKSVWERKERMEVDMKYAVRERVSMLAPAEEATTLNPNARMQETIGAGLGGLCLGLFAVAYREQRRGFIHRLSDVSQGLRLPVFGSLPQLSEEASAMIGELLLRPIGREGAALADSTDGIRTRLLHDYADRGTVIAIASPCPGEGKSTLAASLAASLARSGRRTLLVDCDLRRPTMQKLFQVPDGPGLCQVLSGRAGVDAAIRRTDVEGLDLLPAGDFDPDSLVALTQPVTRVLFSGLKAKYDFIVMDTSPLLCAPDAFIAARQANVLLMSVRSGVSLGTDVTTGYERLREHRLPFLGIVVSGVEESLRHYRAYAASGEAVPKPMAVS